jgi:hypothetical protein
MTTTVGVGFSQVASPKEAGHNAMQQALESSAGQGPDFVLLLSTADMEPSEILSGVRTASQAPLIGGCSTGIIVPQGAYDHGVAVLAFGGPEIEVVTSVVHDYGTDPMGAGRTLVQELRAKAVSAGRPFAGLLLIVADSQTSSAAMVDVVQALGDEMGPSRHLVGGGAQDPSGKIERSVFADDRAYGNAVAGAMILTPSTTGVGVRHGYRPFGPVMVVTRVDGSTLYSLDGRSAYQAYVDQFPNRADLTPENFGQFALDHPLGLPQIGHEYIIRDPFGAGPRGELFCAGVIPRRAVVQIMEGDKETLIEAAQQSAQQAIAPLQREAPLAGVVFSCVSRLGYLGPAAQDEVATIRETLGVKTPFIGLFSFGEIAAQQDCLPEFHNKTAVVGVIGRP